MFDWDDQELAHIIWGEGREADDHIVPFTEDIEKKLLSDHENNDQKTLIGEESESKAAENITSTSKLFLDGNKRDTADGLSASGAVVDFHLDVPSISASKTDNGCIAKKSDIDIDPESSHNHHEDKELGDLVNNSWASIGSFDDLDRIFSNDDLDGNTSLGSTDELWSSPKHIISGAAKSSSAALGSTDWEFEALRNTSANIEINSEYLHNENQAVAASCQKIDISPYSGQNVNRHVKQEECAVGTTRLVKDKIGSGITVKRSIDSHAAAENIASPNKSTNMLQEKWSKSELRHEQATDRITDSGLLRDVYDTWPLAAENVQQFGRQRATSTNKKYPTFVCGQQQLSQELRPMPYQHYSTPYGAPYAYGNITNQYPVKRPLKPTEEYQSLLSSSDKPMETNTKPTNMTPQEKIEKLRKRQQMRAMLAIQKQQQRLGHQALSGDQSLSRKNCQDDQVRHTEKIELEADEILSTLPYYDPGSSNKEEGSSTISNIDDYSVGDTVLYQLQDIISSLDLEIRLCIRDSLYRLADSATQRHYASNTSSTKRSKTYEPNIAKQATSSHESFVGNANVETETNHIDRAVAHLLFHRPFKLSDRHAEALESSTSAKASTKQEIAAPSSLPVGLLAKSSENEYSLSPHESKGPLPFLDSNEEHISNDMSRKEMRSNPQVKQTMAEHAN